MIEVGKIRSRQRQMAVGLTVLDGAIGALVLVLAFSTGSLTLLSDALYSMILLGFQVYSVWAMSGAHGGRFRGFSFGTGKIERTVWAVLGLGLLLATFWLGSRTIAVMTGAHAPAKIGDMTAAAILNSLALLISFCGYVAMLRLLRMQESLAFRALVLVRNTKLLEAVVVQGVLTAAVVLRDPVIAFVLDLFGAIIVMVLKGGRGLAALHVSVADLLDAPPPPHWAEEIRRVVGGRIPEQALVSLRSRRRGAEIEVEMMLVPHSSGFGDPWQSKVDIERELAERGIAVDAVISFAARPDLQEPRDGS